MTWIVWIKIRIFNIIEADGAIQERGADSIRRFKVKGSTLRIADDRAL
jgi:hypothetical protein